MSFNEGTGSLNPYEKKIKEQEMIKYLPVTYFGSTNLFDFLIKFKDRLTINYYEGDGNLRIETRSQEDTALNTRQSNGDIIDFYERFVKLEFPGCVESEGVYHMTEEDQLQLRIENDIQMFNINYNTNLTPPKFPERKVRYVAIRRLIIMADLGRLYGETAIFALLTLLRIPKLPGTAPRW